VDSCRVGQIGGDHEVQTTRRTPALLQHRHTAGQVVPAVRRIDDQMSRDDHHDVLLSFRRVLLRPPRSGEIIDIPGERNAVKLGEALDSIVPDPGAAQVYGQPYEPPDGATIVPVARVRGRAKPGDDAHFRLTARPVGVFVVKNGETSWVPAVDKTRIA